MSTDYLMAGIDLKCFPIAGKRLLKGSQNFYDRHLKHRGQLGRILFLLAASGLLDRFTKTKAFAFLLYAGQYTTLVRDSLLAREGVGLPLQGLPWRPWVLSGPR